MPSPGNYSFVEPSFLAKIVRKTEQVSIPQLVDSLVALGWSSTGLSSKVRASLNTTLTRPQYACAEASIVAHPIAAVSWQLVCSSSDGSLNRIKDLDHLIRGDWRRHDQRGCCSQAVVYITAFTNECRAAFGNYPINTARLLRTSLWIDLLKKDAKAARSWQVCDLTIWPHADTCPAATFQNSKSQTVFVVVPNGALNNIASALSAAKELAKKKDWILEVYSLKFPALNQLRDNYPDLYSIQHFFPGLFGDD